jgi:hypothetical protein
MFIDLTTASLVEIEVWSLQLRGNIIFGPTMRDLVFEVTILTGRMFSPPDWSQKVLTFHSIFLIMILREQLLVLKVEQIM